MQGEAHEKLALITKPLIEVDAITGEVPGKECTIHINGQEDASISRDTPMKLNENE